MTLRDDALSDLQMLRDDNATIRQANLQHFKEVLAERLGVDVTPTDFKIEIEGITIALIADDCDQLARVTEDTPLLALEDLFIAVWAWPDPETRRKSNRPRWLIISSKAALGELIQGNCIAEYMSRNRNEDTIEHYQQHTPKLRR
jgi:hypothetical protein